MATHCNCSHLRFNRLKWKRIDMGKLSFVCVQLRELNSACLTASILFRYSDAIKGCLQWMTVKWIRSIETATHCNHSHLGFHRLKWKRIDMRKLRFVRVRLRELNTARLPASSLLRYSDVSKGCSLSWALSQLWMSDGTSQDEGLGQESCLDSRACSLAPCGIWWLRLWKH